MLGHQHPLGIQGGSQSFQGARFRVVSAGQQAVKVGQLHSDLLSDDWYRFFEHGATVADLIQKIQRITCDIFSIRKFYKTSFNFLILLQMILFFINSMFHYTFIQTQTHSTIASIVTWNPYCISLMFG